MITISQKPFRNEVFVEIKEPSFVYIDLTHCCNKHMMYLCLLNAMGNLQYYFDFIEKCKVSQNAFIFFSKIFKTKYCSYLFQKISKLNK